MYLLLCGTPSGVPVTVKINILLKGGYGLCAVLIILSAYLLTLGIAEWMLFFNWGAGLAVFFTIVWAILKAL